MTMEQMTETRSGALAVLAQQGALLRRNLRKPISIESRRIAVERVITLEFPHFGAFFAEYSTNVSMTGMFIRTDRFQPPGTLATVEFNLADGMPLISGKAKVVWVRERHEGPDRPAGLGLRFVELDDEGRQLIRWEVERRLREAGSNEIEEPLAEVASARGDDADRPLDDGAAPAVAEVDLVPSRGEAEIETRLHPYAGARSARIGSGRRWAVYVGFLGLLACALLYLYHGRAPASTPGAAVVEAVPLEEAAPSDIHEATAISPQAAVPAAPRAESPAADLGSPEIVDMLAAWAEAWSAQQVDAYLSFYAGSYQPAGDMTAARWRELRRDRITGPRLIEVEIADLEVRRVDTRRARASFLQTYASDRYRDRTRKILDLVLEDGRWKILRERSEN